MEALKSKMNSKWEWCRCDGMQKCCKCGKTYSVGFDSRMSIVLNLLHYNGEHYCLDCLLDSLTCGVDGELPGA